MDFWAEFSAFIQIVLIDITLAGDNAIIVGMAAAGLPTRERHRAILIGIGAAAILRIIFALFAVQLMEIIGLMLAGGLLLLWVSWKMYKQLRSPNPFTTFTPCETAIEAEQKEAEKEKVTKKLKDAVIQIVVADVSMSLDNVLGVAGAAREHPWILVTGLALSVILMGAAATAVVKLLHRFRWIGWAGLLVVVYVALSLIWDGWQEVGKELSSFM